MQSKTTDYGSPTEGSSEEYRARRELARIRSTMSFKLGILLTTAVKKPWLIPLLPFTFIHLVWNHGMQRLGKQQAYREPGSREEKSEARDCVLLFPTNGVGMGHFSRMFCLAKAIKRRSPKTEVVFFTTNYVLHPLYRNEFTAYHLPNRNKFESMTATIWNAQCEEMLANIIAVHRPHTFVYDGSFPYRGMLNAIASKPTMKRIWVRRQSKSKGDNTPVDAFLHFDKIAVPGDLLEPDMEILSTWEVDEINLLPPLLSIGRSDLSAKGMLRDKLGIPEDATVALVILGAGAINDINSIREDVVSTLLDLEAFVIVGDSMLNPARPLFRHPNLRVIEDYPIMRFRRCFDLAVIAGGYNSVHETMLLRLPSLVIPNHNAKRDDQGGRAKKAAESNGLMLLESHNKEMLKLALERLMDSEIRSEMAEALLKNKVKDGATVFADSILEQFSSQ